MHITGAMREAKVGDNPALNDRKVALALEVVTHCSLNGNLSCLEVVAFKMILDICIAEQLQNPLAALTPFFAAILVIGHQNGSCAKVIPRSLINPDRSPLGD